MYRSTELIAEIKKRPTLWDSAYKHSADKDLRDMHWAEVAKVLFPNWETLSPADKTEKLYELKRRWKNVRDYYRKESKRWKGKSMYKDLLKFLDDPPSVDRPDVCYEKLRDGVSKASSEQLHYESIEELEKVPFAEASVEENLILTKSNEATVFEEVESTTTKRKREEVADIDEDKSFLLSLLAEIRKLNGRDKMDFKISVLNDLKKARYGEHCTEIKEECEL